MVKVVATRRSPPRSNELSIVLCLPAYTDVQLLRIMSALHSLQREEIQLKQRQHLVSDEASCLGEVGGEEREAFDRLCEQALPFISLHTRHVNEVWASVTALWDRQQRRRARGDRQVDRVGQGGATMSAGGLVGGRRRAAKRSIEDDVGVLMHQPTPHCSNMFDSSVAPATVARESVTCPVGVPHSWGIDATLPINTATCKPLLVGRRFIAYLTHRCTHPDFGLVVHLTVLGKGWCLDLSVMARVMLLAAYLASRNPQDTDRTTFGNALKGRRKKARVSAGGAPGEGGGGKMDIHDHRCVPRAFGLERLLAIYIQILPASRIAREAAALSGGRDAEAPSGIVKDEPLMDNEALMYATVCVRSFLAKCAAYTHNNFKSDNGSIARLII